MDHKLIESTIPDGLAVTLVGQAGGVGAKTGLYMVKPCLTPGRIEKRQNGRRLKEDGDPMFTLTAQDIHGVLIDERETKDQDSEPHRS